MPRLIRAATRTAVVAGTATAVSGRVARRQNEKWSQQQAEQQAQQAPAQPAPPAAPPPPAPAQSSADDQIAQLKRLEELKTAGVISEAEYESQRKKVLGF